VGFITPWNQACGLATYAKFFIPHLACDVVAVFAEDGCAVVGHDEPFVTRCWSRVARDSSNDYAPLDAAIRKARLDVLHINCHSTFFEQPTFSELLSRLRGTGIKIVAHVHQIFTKIPQHQALFAMVDRVIVHSSEVRLEAIANGARPETVVVVPHGVQIREDLAGQSRESLRAKLGINH